MAILVIAMVYSRAYLVTCVDMKLVGGRCVGIKVACVRYRYKVVSARYRYKVVCVRSMVVCVR